jgi:xylose isomerase
VTSFGGQTRSYEWDKAGDAVQRAKDKLDAGFEIMDKLGIEYFCFHDIDLVEEGATIEEYESRMKAVTDYALERMKKQQQETALGHSQRVRT